MDEKTSIQVSLAAKYLKLEFSVKQQLHQSFVLKLKRGGWYSLESPEFTCINVTKYLEVVETDRNVALVDYS